MTKSCHLGIVVFQMTYQDIYMLCLIVDCISFQVHVLPPSDMKFAPKRVEAMVTTELELPLAVFGLLQGQFIFVMNVL